MAQIITTSPAIPTEDQAVKITFDATMGNAGLKDYSGDVYVHTGVITDKSTSSSDWKYVITQWGVNTPAFKMTRIAQNLYELNITPGIRSYYGVPANEKILKMAFVFRSADVSASALKEGKETEGKDIFVDVHEPGLNVVFSLPALNFSLIPSGQSFPIQAIATANDSICLFLDGTKIKTSKDQMLQDTLTASGSNRHTLVAVVYQGTQSNTDTAYYLARNTAQSLPVPTGMHTGINYIDDQTVTLVFYAPFKSYVYVIGDFNDWTPDNAYLMNQDGDRYWLTINNLTPQKEYIYQYLVDGTLHIADPYTDKVSDPYDDKYISSTTYPGLIAYPAGKTSERASVLQTGQTPYSWKTTSYTVPAKQNLLVYELLIRDFTQEGTIKAAKTRIDYLKHLGINAIELMPFNEFEGNISWGYNPNFYFAPDKAYGTKNDYKDFIDECHKQGLIVIQDMVLNHAYGSCPLAKLYWDDANGKPAANNPWFNVTSPNPTYSWGCDFNHQSAATKQLVDSINKYWMSEYKIDGFRYDFVKGFTNSPGEGTAYDASRIAILERMSDVVWSYKPEAYIILESFTANQEEAELADYKNGMLIWGNANSNFCQASMGFNDNSSSDFSWASASSRGYTQPGLISYMESHDEERVMFKTLSYGNASGSYNVKTKPNGLHRGGMAATFLLSIPGPKMIWQFGEMGYDVSIDYNDRTGIKPTHWEYLNDSAHLWLNKVYRAMFRLRALYPVFTSGTINMQVGDAMKRINLSSNDLNVSLIGNFGVTSDVISPSFQHAGTWYEFFTNSSYEVTNTTQGIPLQPGEFRLYTDKELPRFMDIGTKTPDLHQNSGINIFPNPAGGQVTLTSKNEIHDLHIYNLSGKLLRCIPMIPSGSTSIDLQDSNPGIYLMKCQSQGAIYTQKLVIQ